MNPSHLPIVLDQRDRWAGKYDRQHDRSRQPKRSHGVIGRSRAFVPVHRTVEKVAVVETAMIRIVEPAGVDQLMSRDAVQRYFKVFDECAQVARLKLL